MITIRIDLNNDRIIKRVEQLESEHYHIVAIEDNRYIILIKYYDDRIRTNI